ncbi:hypothetical protein D9623_00370 [Azospirillum brasilense]|uniref:Uncharacterized protein n=2 Tax=Pseudomonadota TaxID=1224 RepID=A0A0P0F3T4_AZOBR|nr:MULTISPECIES: hypothetical protein [Azospirillum]ALJ34260.1 hypothetical protein AMK58_01840 [Azospirillum brasilense]MDW7552751.1 hypothetical protein [Azospirillum brasilense]MDW7592057.1 hypothetical protein [Azospirillum brasilense]MDW7627666.1 hypothetical protein [Azospirillum brasilense]MDX5952865.1 hypothetical protein [Azospirillum brasilense]
MTNKAKHQWAATGVSSYPLSHPIVGQGRFFEAFRHFIHLVDDEAEKFAHVFAVVARWGIGKSRLGYELVAQINDTSRGWWVRGDDGALSKAQLFHDDQDRDQYLGLYVRYSQVANDYNNVDNWFAYGLYKALLPLARGTFDGSIQGQIAKEAADRLAVAGFDAQRLAAALEVSANHSDETLYVDPELATRLCQAAYAYLQSLGIKYVLVVLDELETAAEAATFGLDSTDIKHLDGRAIKLMGKAIKEEDPRRKLPWLRYVALCSPAIGDELREIQSTVRRFEMEELQSNAFSDVSDFVQALGDDGRLAESYPQGLVEAAYAMSAGNFGWFNVIMASIDERLRDKRLRGETDTPTVGSLFDELVRVSGRVRQHVLDHNAIAMLKMPDRSHLATARDLLYGQLPVPLDAYSAETRAAVLGARNEYDEPVVTLFSRVAWDGLEAAEALRVSKFTRDRGMWRLGGVDQPLDLGQLLSNLGTYAIHETKGRPRTDGKHTLVVPLRQTDFVHLVSLLYPHPAAEDAARALWRRFLGAEDLEPDTATHVGPSVEMIARLDLRHRKQGQTSLIFRDPDQNAAHEAALSALRAQTEQQRARQMLVGAMRVIDQHWAYDAVASGIRDESLTVIGTAPRSRGASGGLVTFDGLKLHPRGRVLFAWVKNDDELVSLCKAASTQFGEEGRTPVVAFTASRALADRMANPSVQTLRDAKGYLLLYQLTSTEEHILHQVGVATSACVGFRLDHHGFTTAFNNRLQSLVRQFSDEVGRFRRQLDDLGRIAWPFRPAGRLKEAEEELLRRAWRVLAIDKQESVTLADLDDKSRVDVEALKALLAKLGVSPKARAAGYLDSERAGLFSRLDDSAEPLFPAFLVGTIKRVLDGEWSFAHAEHEWFWGYIWEGVKPKEIYLEWMSLICELGFGKPKPGATTNDVYTPTTRSELRGSVQEADNWLTTEYPTLVSDMETVFGAGLVKELFASESSGPGTKTLKAREKLKESRTDLDALDAFETRSATAESYRIAAQRRRRVLDAVNWVYRREDFQALQQDANIRTLDIHLDDVPLWQRIRRASLFAGFVRRAEERIRVRTVSLADEIRVDVASLRGFPIALFTLSLEKIVHILDGALAPTATPGATEVGQAKEPGTLRQHLRDFQVAEATLQLENLAREVGLDLVTWKEHPLDRCEGQIITAFRELKGVYEKLRTDLDDATKRISTLQTVLTQAPADFRYPSSAIPFDKLQKRPALIQEALENAQAEDVERLRSEYDGPARLGNFQPLMLKARDLLEEPRKPLMLLLSSVITVENAVTEYRKRLLEDPQLFWSQRSREALAHALGVAGPKPLTFTDIEDAGSLVAAQALVKAHTQGNSAEGEALLHGAGVSFDRWCAIVAALDDGRDPDLALQEADALVRRGLIQRTYRLGERP